MVVRSEPLTRVGIIGCGVIGQFHASVLRDIEGAELVAVADPAPEVGREVAERFGGEYMPLEEMLASGNVDAVSVCTPSGLHSQIGVLAANAGKHVLVEKPIDVSLEAADRLIAVAARNDVRLGVVSQHRFDPPLIRLNEAIESGGLGDLWLGEAIVKWWRTQDYYDSSAWRGTRLMDGGALLNQGVHYVDVLLWLMGPARRVFANCATLGHRMESEDVALVNIEFASGALGQIQATTLAFPGFTERLSITGSNGTVLVEGSELVAWGVRGESAAETAGSAPPSASANPTALATAAHRDQYLDFLAAVREGRPPRLGPEEGRRALEVVVAAYESARTGQPVDLSVGVPT